MTNEACSSFEENYEYDFNNGLSYNDLSLYDIDFSDDDIELDLEFYSGCCYESFFKECYSFCEMFFI